MFTLSLLSQQSVALRFRGTLQVLLLPLSQYVGFSRRYCGVASHSEHRVKVGRLLCIDFVRRLNYDRAPKVMTAGGHECMGTHRTVLPFSEWSCHSRILCGSGMWTHLTFIAIVGQSR
jgi:hypothetical protein